MSTVYFICQVCRKKDVLAHKKQIKDDKFTCAACLEAESKKEVK